MKDYSKTRRIPLEAATKEELIVAIKSLMMFDAVKNAESAVYRAREDMLLRKMGEICTEIDDSLTKSKPITYRLSLHEKFDKVNRELNKLQGT